MFGKDKKEMDESKKTPGGGTMPSVEETPSTPTEEKTPVETPAAAVQEPDWPQELVARFGQVEKAVFSSVEELNKKVSAMTTKFEGLANQLSRQHDLASDQLVRTVGQLRNELSQAEEDRNSWQQSFAEKEAELAKTANDLAATNTMMGVQKQESSERIEQLEGELRTAQETLEAAEMAHREEVSRLSQERDEKVAEQTRLGQEKLAAQEEQSARQIETLKRSIGAFVPLEVCELFDYRVGDPEDHARWQSIYAYLGFVNGSLRPDVFVKRFREFDAAFYDAFRDAPELLAECRARVQRHLNEVIGAKTGGLKVCWPKIGEPCNPDQYTTVSDFGQRISEVIGAMVYRQGDDGGILCLSKGKVATER